MGTDIHAVIEVRVGKEWHKYTDCDMVRNYSLFSRMANVRNGKMDIVPISSPRGLPVDVSTVAKIDSESWAGDGHSHSYLHFHEMVSLVSGGYEAKGRDRYAGPFGCLLFGNYITEWKNPWYEFPKSVQDVRIVFWFDN